VVIVTRAVYGPIIPDDPWHGGARQGRTRRAVIDATTTDAGWIQLGRLDQGVASISRRRHQRSQVATERFLGAAARMKSRNWHIQLNTTLP